MMFACTIVLRSPVTSTHMAVFCRTGLPRSNVVQMRQRPEPGPNRPPFPDVPEPYPTPDRNWGDKILPNVGPHGPGEGEPGSTPEEPCEEESGQFLRAGRRREGTYG